MNNKTIDNHRSKSHTKERDLIIKNMKSKLSDKISQVSNERTRSTVRNMNNFLETNGVR